MSKLKLNYMTVLNLKLLKNIVLFSFSKNLIKQKNCSIKFMYKESKSFENFLYFLRAIKCRVCLINYSIIHLVDTVKNHKITLTVS